ALQVYRTVDPSRDSPPAALPPPTAPVPAGRPARAAPGAPRSGAAATAARGATALISRDRDGGAVGVRARVGVRRRLNRDRAGGRHDDPVGEPRSRASDGDIDRDRRADRDRATRRVGLRLRPIAARAATAALRSTLAGLGVPEVALIADLPGDAAARRARG